MTTDSITEKKHLILIVDDERLFREAYRDILQNAGFETVLAADGHTAVTFFNERDPDLILLDLIMPGMDGFTTCRQLRTLPGGLSTPVLMVTGLDDPESINKAFDAGATDFITKPVQHDLLVFRIHYMLRASQSIKEKKQAEERLLLLKEAVDCLPLGITITDVNGRIMYTNPTEALMHGTTTEELFGRHARNFAPTHLRNPSPAAWRSYNGVWKRESINIRNTGEEFPVQLLSIAVRNTEGTCLGMVTACEDITQRKESEERIHSLAYYDTLTGLPNRGTFLERLHQALTMAQRQCHQVGLLFLDLDSFKDVNDTQGHDFGDKLLKAVSSRIVSVMRDSDTLARLGGDEFVIVLPSLDARESAAVATERILSVFENPFELDGQLLYTSASTGIAIYPDDAQDADGLFKCADTAMYHAKNEARGSYRFFSIEMNQLIMRRVALENGLRHGLEKNEFFLHYQPQWDLNTGRMVGAEALVRWHSSEFGILQPAEFIPLVEKTGLILPLGEWILRTACIQARDWSRDEQLPFRVAINISGRQFRQADFLEMTERIIRETGVDPSVLEFEFTESVIMEKAGRTIRILRALKSMGIQLSIDDFGTGYSSLSYLKHFPIDRIKIDRSFIADIKKSSDDAAIVEAIISLCHSLKLKVMAEGVETADQIHFLTARNCSEAQGFLLAHPMEASGITGNLTYRCHSLDNGKNSDVLQSDHPRFPDNPERS
jgi:diguanylate cyclase (GGDEF)-like protein/PAS domain S-box-containing protein